MKSKITIFVLLAVFFLCCKEKKQKEIVRSLQNESSFTNKKYILNNDFVFELEKWAKYVENNIDTTWNNKNCYTIEFFHKKWKDIELGNDTLVIISYYSQPSDSLGYQGILKLDSFNVAIFDHDSIGGAYYNKTVLKDIPLSDMTKGKLLYGKLIINLFILEHGKLKKKVRL